MCTNMLFSFKSKKNPSVVNLRDEKFNRFAVDSGYSLELVRIFKSIKKNQWDPATKNWLLHKDYYYEFKQKIADKLKIELDLNEEEVIKRKVIVEELNKKYLVRNDVAVTDEIKEILKPYLYCKYRNGWVITKQQSEMFFHKMSPIDYDFKPKPDYQPEGITEIQLIKHDNILTGDVGVKVKISQYDERVIEKIKTFEYYLYDPSDKTWLMDVKHVDELKSFLKLPDFLITESF